MGKSGQLLNLQGLQKRSSTIYYPLMESSLYVFFHIVESSVARKFTDRGLFESSDFIVIVRLSKNHCIFLYIYKLTGPDEAPRLPT